MFDKSEAAWKPSVVQIRLTKDLEKFVVEKAKAGGYVDPSEVVRGALREFRSKDDPGEVDSQELAELLLPAVRGPHRLLTEKHFNILRRRARRKPARR